MEEDFLSLMDDGGETRDDLKCPDGEIGEQIRAAIEAENDILVSNNFIQSYVYSWTSKLMIIYHRPVLITLVENRLLITRIFNDFIINVNIN